MRKLLCSIVLISAFSSCGGDSGGGTQLGLDQNLSRTCTFQLSSFLNGSNPQNSRNYWECRSNGRVFTTQIYNNGTGYSNTGGAYTWSQTGCNSIVLNTSANTETITDIAGSVNSGIVTFRDTIQTTTVNVSCVLVNL